jgi:Protein of unknown function (DUF3309)
LSAPGSKAIDGNTLLPGLETARRPSPLESVAEVFTGFFELFGSLEIFAWQVLRDAVTPPYEWRELIRLLDEVGSSFIGCIAAYPDSRSWRYRPVGGVGLILLVLVITAFDGSHLTIVR